MNGELNLLDSLEEFLRQCIELIGNYRQTRPRSRGSFTDISQIVLNLMTINTKHLYGHENAYSLG